jgi:hypothetical protein
MSWDEFIAFLIEFLRSNFTAISTGSLNVYQTSRKLHGLLKKLGISINSSLVPFSLPGYSGIDVVPKYFGGLFLKFMSLFEIYSLVDMLNYKGISNVWFLFTKGNLIRIIFETIEGKFLELNSGILSTLPPTTTGDSLSVESIDVLSRDFSNISRYTYFFNRNYINHSNNRVDM